MVKVYVVSQLNSNLHRYVASAHETEHGAAWAVLEDYYREHLSYKAKELMGWPDEDYDSEEDKDELTEEQKYLLCQKVVEDFGAYRENETSGLFMHLWVEEQDGEYVIDTFDLQQ